MITKDDDDDEAGRHGEGCGEKAGEGGGRSCEPRVLGATPVARAHHDLLGMTFGASMPPDPKATPRVLAILPLASSTSSLL